MQEGFSAASIEHQLGKADVAGKQVRAVCRHLIDRAGPYAIRRVLAILALVKKHGPDRIDRACRAALEVGVPTYRFVKRYLEDQHTCLVDVSYPTICRARRS